MFHQNTITGLAVLSSLSDENGEREALVTTSYDSTVRIWNMVTTNAMGNDGLTVLFLRNPLKMALISTSHDSIARPGQSQTTLNDITEDMSREYISALQVGTGLSETRSLCCSQHYTAMKEHTILIHFN